MSNMTVREWANQKLAAEAAEKRAANENRLATQAAEISRLKAENERLRAHIQEAADERGGMIERYAGLEGSIYFERRRNWHLAALAPQEKDHG